MNYFNHVNNVVKWAPTGSINAIRGKRMRHRSLCNISRFSIVLNHPERENIFPTCQSIHHLSDLTIFNSAITTKKTEQGFEKQFLVPNSMLYGRVSD